jgi:hypothetical protein
VTGDGDAIRLAGSAGAPRSPLELLKPISLAS